MSEVALSQELYDLSGWVDTTYFKDGKHCFDYTLGFLVRRLKRHGTGVRYVEGRWHDDTLGYYTAGIFGDYEEYLQDAKIAEDALCLLAIELIKQNIITPEQAGEEYHGAN